MSTMWYNLYKGEKTMEDNSFFFMFLFFIVSGLISIGIYIVQWIQYLNKQCPQSRICRDSKCERRAWCRKYKRKSEKIIHIREIQKVKKKRQKRR